MKCCSKLFCALQGKQSKTHPRALGEMYSYVLSFKQQELQAMAYF